MAAERISNILTHLEATRHVRVASVHMPYRDARRRDRGLKIYLCREPAFTGALDAAAVHVKVKILWKILETYYEKGVIDLVGRTRRVRENCPAGTRLRYNDRMGTANGFW